MVRVFASIIVLMAFCGGAMAECSSPSLDEVQNEADAAITEIAAEIADTVIDEPDIDFFEDCIANIGNFGAGFSFGVPSLSDILSAACEALMDEMDSYIDDYLGDLLLDGSLSVGILSAKYEAGYGLGDGRFLKDPPIEIGVESPEILNDIKGAIDAALPKDKD
ncbi:hypothetical protein DSCO28_73320 (plasmid) [Desulfosarcina ovata subsp. sediminis]|uniref:Lipoprotein n=1 Tax=Desulfosarcina ovata subsp. sediminis TaxID=885957 RepID=A0A5K8A2U8_9BACT|nr:hypothetical protein [Desulfosarcina ovata]BBO86766.1 hypothetical protein DSCO28_73320 [Desulfosarcina ovata subsp. sediminis]